MRVPVLLFGLTLISGCTFLQSATNYQSVIMDERVLEQCSRETPRAEGFWNPTLKMARQLEQDLPVLDGTTAPRIADVPAFLMDVSDYTYQYVGVVVDGRDLVYINAFYHLSKIHNDKWQFEPVNVCGGYTHFWGALYDPVERTFSDLTFNKASQVRPAIKIGRRNLETAPAQ